MSGITISMRRPMSSTCIFRGCAPRSTKASSARCFIRFAALATSGWSETAYRRLDEQDATDHRALVRVTELPGGFRLLIGRDLDERRRLFGIVAKAAQWSLLIVIVLGLGGGVFVARRVLRRIDAMTRTTRRSMAACLNA